MFQDLAIAEIDYLEQNNKDTSLENAETLENNENVESSDATDNTKVEEQKEESKEKKNSQTKNNHNTGLPSQSRPSPPRRHRGGSGGVVRWT